MAVKETQQFKLQNLSCANCAAKFEKNVQEIPQVEACQLNFATAKLTVVGAVTVEQLEEAGAFDGIQVTKASDRTQKPRPFYKRKENVLAAISFIFVVMGLFFSLQRGEGNIISNSMFAVAIVVGGVGIFKQGIKNLLRLEFDMKTLMTIAVIGAAMIGEWQEAAIVVFLFAISEALEAYSINKARQSIEKLLDIAPPIALIRRTHGEHVHELEVATEDVIVGDIMLVKPGQKIAMDGVVINGLSTVNQAAITGESVPVKKAVGDDVFAGTLNEEGALEVEVTKLVTDTTLAKIINLVEEAQAEKAPSQKFVDRFAKYYTPIIMFVALCVAVLPPLFVGDWQHWIYQGLAVLVVGCPCALVISTPVAIVTAIGQAAKEGVLIKGGAYLEQLGQIRAFAFDKTGTLTQGVPAVTDIIAANHLTESALMSKVCAIEKNAEHPLARAILAYQHELRIPVVQADGFQSLTGKGIYAMVEQQKIYVGSIDWIREFVDLSAYEADIHRLASEGKSVIAAVTDETFLGIIGIADRIRSESRDVIHALESQQMKTVMLTGDAPVTAHAIAQQMQLSDVRAGLLPEHKLTAVKELKEQCGVVAMVGDGINDAPALAAADIGIAMGGAGTDAALETADVVLMSDQLDKLSYLVKLSKRTLVIIKQNIIFALGLKAVALLLVIPGWLTLWIAIFADIGATLLVVANSLRLLKKNT